VWIERRVGYVLRWAGNFYSNLQILYFLLFGQGYLGKAADFHSPRGIERNGSAVEPGAGLIPEPLQRLRLAEMILFPL